LDEETRTALVLERLFGAMLHLEVSRALHARGGDEWPNKGRIPVWFVLERDGAVRDAGALRGERLYNAWASLGRARVIKPIPQAARPAQFSRDFLNELDL
jgi:hypothetical protein